MASITWLQGKDLIEVNVGTTQVEIAHTSIILQSGHAALLPSAPFYMFFPGNPGTGETPEYIHVSAKNNGTDTLTVSAPPFGNTGGNGRAALANGAPSNYAAAVHPAGTRIQLRSTWEHIQQIQTQIDAHDHTGTSGNGPVLGTSAINDNAITTNKINALAVTAAKIANNTITATQIANSTITSTQVDATTVATLAGTQTFTGVKTMNSPTFNTPQINIGSDARGDMYYRSSGGALSRIAVPSAGNRAEYVLQADSNGDISWVAPRRYFHNFMFIGA